MSITTIGVVTNGVVVPQSPLPEGARVEIRVQLGASMPEELTDEFEAWERAGAGTLELVERMAEEMEANEKR
jgi:hypothetical protein